jgi:hypothetical protein
VAALRLSLNQLIQPCSQQGGGDFEQGRTPV